MKTILIAFWRFFHALVFYPLLIAIFIWLYVTGAHWIYGLAVIGLALIFDPIWRILCRSFLTKARHFIRRNSL